MSHTHDESYADDDGFHPAYHRHTVFALRLILAELIDGAHMTNTDRDNIAPEVGDCAGCWQAIAHHAVFEAAAAMSLHFGEDKAIKEIQAELKNTLDAGRQP